MTVNLPTSNQQDGEYDINSIGCTLPQKHTGLSLNSARRGIYSSASGECLYEFDTKTAALVRGF